MRLVRDGAGLPERLRTWLVVGGSRLRIAAALLGVVLSLMLAFTVVGILPRSPDDPLYFLFSALLGGNLTLITVVITINQLVLSRELGSPGELRRRMEEAVAFRDDVRFGDGGSASPVSPETFLLELHERLDDLALSLASTLATSGDERSSPEIDPLVESIRADAREVAAALDAGGGGSVAAVAATLGTTHAEQLAELDRLAGEARGELPREAREAVEAVRELLLHIDVARNYFRTVYVERELAVLSRVILYVGVPAQVAVAAALALYVGPGVVPAAAYALVVPVAVTAGFAPLAVLFSFVLRLSWIAERNVSSIPFAGVESQPP